MKIALLGFGVVGGGVWEMLRERTDMEITAVLTRRDRPELGGKAVYSIDPIVNDPSIDLVVEVMGGLSPAYEYVSAALKAGKHVVTANKALVAAYYNELTALAKENGVALRCTAAVGGGIPWLTSLERVCRLDKVQSISGILNGTTNYILDVMTREGKDFAEVLSAAQELGYAEADPTADIDGWDIRRKLVISANIAFDASVQEEAIPMAGIRGITAEDIQAFTEAGLVCRMIASAARQADGVSAVVEPTLLPKTAPEAAVPLNFNRISLNAEKLGGQAFFGQGAGRFPTASNVIQDCIDVLGGKRAFYTDTAVPSSICNGSLCRSYYLRTDAPEAFDGMIAGKLGPGYVTKPVSVAELHAKSASCRFLAALPENYGKEA